MWSFHLCRCRGESGERDINSVLGHLKVGLRAIWMIFGSDDDDAADDDDDADAGDDDGDDDDADDADDDDDDADLSVGRWRL